MVAPVSTFVNIDIDLTSQCMTEARERESTYSDAEVVCDDPLSAILDTRHAVHVVRIVLVEPLVEEDISIELEEVATGAVLDPTSSVVDPTRSSLIVSVAELPWTVVVAIGVVFTNIDVELCIVSSPW